MADTDQNPIPKGKAVRDIDWKALSQYVGATLAGVALLVSGWVHGVLMGYGDRLTKLEERGEAAKTAREEEVKQRDKDAAALQKSIDQMRDAMTTQLQSLDQRQSQMAQGVTSLQLDLVRATAGRNSGGMP